MKSPKTHWTLLAALGAVATAGTLAAATSAPAPATKAEPTASPEELITTRCLICHGKPTAGRRLAPPFRMVKRHYDDLDEAAFVKAVSAWVKQPDKAKSRMPGAIRNFGLMPPQPYPEAEIAAIAAYLYRTEFSMPGRGGPGMGRGMGRGGQGMGPRGPGGPACDDETSSTPKATAGCGGSCGNTRAGGCGGCAPGKTATPGTKDACAPGPMDAAECGVEADKQDD